MQKRILLSDNGFTLIEALIAMAVLTVGILTLYTMQMTAITGNATASRLTRASTVAADSYERLLQVPYNDPIIMNATTNPHDHTQFTGFTLPAGVNFVNWNVTEWTNADNTDNDGDGETDEGDETGIKLVTLTVNYNDRGPAKTLTVNFYKHELF